MEDQYFILYRPHNLFNTLSSCYFVIMKICALVLKMPDRHILGHKSSSYLLGTSLDCINEDKYLKDTFYILLNWFQESLVHSAIP